MLCCCVLFSGKFTVRQEFYHVYAVCVLIGIIVHVQLDSKPTIMLSRRDVIFNYFLLLAMTPSFLPCSVCVRDNKMDSIHTQWHSTGLGHGVGYQCTRK